MDVELVRWPAESDRRQRLDCAGVPRILVLEGPVAAPVCRHQLEDWVRPPISRSDLAARRQTLLARALANAVPEVDEDNVLIVGQQRLCLSPAEAQLMRVLCAEYGRVVDRDTLVELMWLGSQRTCRERRNAVDLRVLRLRKRLESIHLTVRTVWGRGYLLEDGRSPGGHDADVARPVAG